MKTYVVYEVHSNHPILRKIDTVKASTSESARRKAIIGTSKEYNKTRACCYINNSIRGPYNVF